MAQLQRMNARFDSLTYEMCQMNTHVSRIARRQARHGVFTVSPSSSLEASANEDGDASDDEDLNASSSGDDEMTTSA